MCFPIEELKVIELESNTSKNFHNFRQIQKVENFQKINHESSKYEIYEVI